MDSANKSTFDGAYKLCVFNGTFGLVVLLFRISQTRQGCICDVITLTADFSLNS